MALFGRRERGPAALPVPPFPPDPPAAPLADVAVPDDPVALLAAHGVVLPGALERSQAAVDLPVWTLPVDAEDDALELWEAVRRVHPSTGLWPLLITPGTDETTAAGLLEEPDPVGELDAAAWLTGSAATDLAELPRGERAAWEEPDPSDWVERVAVFPDEPDRLMLVPAAAGWLVPGLLGWTGAVNADVLGDVHTAMLRRWAAWWAAEPVVMGLDTLTLRVGRPPATHGDAVAVAVEMALYCSDIVHQGVGTLEALVPMAASSAWWFWWD